MSIEIKVPEVGESITEVVLSSWVKDTGDYVEMDEVIAEIESDKASFELTAEAEGELEVLVNSGDTVAVGAVVAHIREVDSKKKTEKKANKKDITDEEQVPIATKTNSAKGIPSPAASKILSEKNISPEEVKGTGKDGRITKADALSAKGKPVTVSSSVGSDDKGWRDERVEKLSPLRKTLSKRLVAVKNETAMLTTFNEVDMKPIMDLRSKYKEAFKEKHAVGLGFMSFFTKAICEALKEFPAINAKIDGENIVYHNYTDISIAVSAPKGLVVPVIRNAERMTLAEIEKAVLALAVKARENKLTIPEMTGGTFTITNGGVFGSLLSTPIINTPQSAILGMHNIVKRPVVIDDEIKIRPMMYVALSYDHRIIDGRESVSFLVKVKHYLEDPSRLLLGV